MRRSILLRQALCNCIDDEIASRTQLHQQHVEVLKRQQLVYRNGFLPPPLVILAHGDSWFDYPLSGNEIAFGGTDIIAQLPSVTELKPVILNISHFGDATTDEMSLPKQQRLQKALEDRNNWISQGKPDAMLFSGGGNDIAGDRFCIFLDPETFNEGGLDAARFGGVLAMIEANYKDLFAFRDQHASGVPIFGHCYDFPIPNGIHPLCAGPWLQPSLRYNGWTNTDDGTQILKAALSAFKMMLSKLANNGFNNYTLVDTQGILSSNDWANELHPTPEGFRKLAAKLACELRLKFPRRI